MRKLILFAMTLCAFVVAQAQEGQEPEEVTAKYVKNYNFCSGTTENSGNYSSSGWVQGSTYTGGDQHASWRQRRTVWNAWWAVSVADAGDQYLDVHQDLTGLPSGYYGITCQAITQPGCITDQHAYVASGTRTAVSPVMETEGWVGDDADGEGVWEKLTTDKLLVMDGTLTIGFRSSKANAKEGQGTGNDNREGWWCATEFRLFYYGPASDDDVVAQLDIAIINLSDFLSSSDLYEYSAMCDVIQDLIDEADNIDRDDVAGIRALLDKISATVERTKQAIAVIDQFGPLLDEAYNLLQLGYPGMDDLSEVISEVSEVVEATDESVADDYINAYARLQDAIVAYRFSQEATPDHPADYTFLVQHYNFATTDPGEESTQTSEGWVNGSTYTGGDQHVSWRQSRTAWNAWWAVSAASAGNRYLDVHQDLANLPSGYYGIRCKAITQQGCISDQHAYVTSAAGTAVSPVMQTEGWEGDDATGMGIWEELTTEKVLVVDGTLTIGFRSSKTNAQEGQGTGGDNREGWWCATDFELLYYGQAGDDEVKNAYEEQLATANGLVEKMHFAADRAALKAVVEQNSGKTSGEEMKAALTALQSATEEAQKSESKYEEIMADGKTIPTVRDSLTNEKAYGEARPFAEFAFNFIDAYIKSDEATYLHVDSLLDMAKAYLNSYVPVYAQAAKSRDAYKSESARKVLADVMTAHKDQMLKEMLTGDVVALFAAELNRTLIAANAQNTYEENKDASDWTFMIQNPDIASEEGWTIDKGVGNKNTNTGQHYSGDTSKPYLDSWNATTGALNYYAEQKITGIPNGVYTVTAATRTSGATGAFIFAATGEEKADTVWSRIEMQYYTNPNSGETVEAQAMYGPIWEEAYKALENNEATPEQEAIALANNMSGWGWMYTKAENVVVSNHEVTIGVTTDVKRTGEPFNGTWFSAVDWTLVRTAKGDDGSWLGPLAGISVVENTAKTAAADGLYDLNGRRLTKAGKGVYVRVENGQARKVVVR